MNNQAKFRTALAMAAAVIVAAGCASSGANKPKGSADNGEDQVKNWIEKRVDAKKAFASQCTVGTVATAINAIGAPLQVMQRNAYEKVDEAYANAKGRRAYKAVAAKAVEYEALSAEDKAAYDGYKKYCVEQDFGKRESALNAMGPDLAKAGVEIGGLVVMAKKDPNFAKLAGLAMAAQVRNVGKDADALKAILDDTNKATDFWKALDAEDREVQRQQKEFEAGMAN